MIARARLTPFALPLRTPLATAQGSLLDREGVLVELETASGASGFGEAMPLPGFGTETLAQCRAAMERMAQALVGRCAEELETARGPLFALAADAPAARCGIDTALHDLAARERDLGMSELLCLLCEAAARVPRKGVAVNALLPESTPEAAAAAAERACSAGFQTLKLKIGAAPFDRDAERVAAVRSAVAPDVRLRLDANGAWKAAQALEALERLAPYAVEFVEQPLAPREDGELARLRTASPIPIAVDESVSGEAVALKLIAAQAADVLVLKPPTLGELSATLRVAARADEAGLDVVIPSFLDSAIGIAAALHTACALRRTLACGLATAELLQRDLIHSPPTLGGVMQRPREPGLGLIPESSNVRVSACGPTLEIGP